MVLGFLIRSDIFYSDVDQKNVVFSPEIGKKQSINKSELIRSYFVLGMSTEEQDEAFFNAKDIASIQSQRETFLSSATAIRNLLKKEDESNSDELDKAYQDLTLQAIVDGISHDELHALILITHFNLKPDDSNQQPAFDKAFKQLADQIIIRAYQKEKSKHSVWFKSKNLGSVVLFTLPISLVCSMMLLVVPLIFLVPPALLLTVSTPLIITGFFALLGATTFIGYKVTRKYHAKPTFDAIAQSKGKMKEKDTPFSKTGELRKVAHEGHLIGTRHQIKRAKSKNILQKYKDSHSGKDSYKLRSIVLGISNNTKIDSVSQMKELVRPNPKSEFKESKKTVQEHYQHLFFEPKGFTFNCKDFKSDNKNERKPLRALKKIAAC